MAGREGMESMLSLSNDEFVILTDFVRSNFGINLERKKSLVEGRLSGYLRDRGFADFPQYFNALFGDRTQGEAGMLVDYLSTNYSCFLREWDHFEYLRDAALPALKESAAGRDLRIWSAGCATGEEPYTLAMVLLDFFGAERALWDTRLLATDISRRALHAARAGVYTDEQMGSVPQEWRARYFRELDCGKWEIGQAVREQVLFRAFNLLDENYPFRKPFHAIFCRNVMIYFDRGTKARLLRRLYDAAAPGAWLFVGHSESVNRDEADWRYVKPSIFRKG
jgi:chemotaxis protein methyltransferase CheR